MKIIDRNDPKKKEDGLKTSLETEKVKLINRDQPEKIEKTECDKCESCTCNNNSNTEKEASK